MMDDKDQDWGREFSQFLNSGERVPDEICVKVTSAIRSKLHPTKLHVFSHLALIHLLAGSATLLVCPQFGYSFTSHSVSLMHFFMKLGPLGCSFACGAFFIGVSSLFAVTLFSREEVRVVRASSVLQFSALTLLSLGAFFCLGGALLPFGYGAAWFMGSLAASVSVTEAGALLRLGPRTA